MDVLNAKEPNIRKVEQALHYRRVGDIGRYSDVLSLETLTDFEQKEVEKISSDFQNHLYSSGVSEGLLKALTTLPLLRLTGFYSLPTELKLEENVAPVVIVVIVVIEERDQVIKGRYDILSINQGASTQDAEPKTPFWILVSEAKNSEISHSAGLPQLLVYAHQSLENQTSVWVS